MCRLKELCDPRGLLNPGVIVNPDPRAHLKDLKPLPPVEEEVDRCIECGFCEPLCPSRDLTTTPRQRIAVRREIARLDAAGTEPELRASLEADFPYDVLDTCAADGLCATACPVRIDTGRLTKRFRALRLSPAARRAAAAAARGFAAIEPALRLALGAGARVRAARPHVDTHPEGASGCACPSGSAPMPRRGAGAAVHARRRRRRRVRSLVPHAHDGRAARRARRPVAPRGARRRRRPRGSGLFIPADVAGTCCGVPFSSKGYDAAHAIALNRAVARMWRWSDAGRLPVVVDTSPCTYGLLHADEALTGENRARRRRMTILDAVEFAHDVPAPSRRDGARAVRGRRISCARS